MRAWPSCCGAGDGRPARPGLGGGVRRGGVERTDGGPPHRLTLAQLALATRLGLSQVRRGLLHIKEIAALEHETPLPGASRAATSCPGESEDWIRYERAQFRMELTRISRLLSGTIAPHAARAARGRVRPAAARPARRGQGLADPAHPALNNGLRHAHASVSLGHHGWRVDAARAAAARPGLRHGPGRAAEKHPRREIVDAIRYLVDNGCKWRALPVDFLVVTWNQASGDHGPLAFTTD